MAFLKLVIRCAHQANDDLKIDAKTDWTVRQLKIYLGNIHPSKPVPERQRIVFAGQLLRDDARLSEYFQRFEIAKDQSNPNIDTTTESYVLHLVYTASVEENVKAAEKRQHERQQETELRQRKLPTYTASSANVQNEQQTLSASASGGLLFSTHSWPSMIPAQQQSHIGATPSSDFYGDWMRQQQQMYAMMSQWYSQYIQAAYGGASVGPVGFYPSFPTALQQPNPPAINVDQQQPQVDAQPEAPRVQGPGQQAMNAQGGIAAVDDEDDPRNRDWLDKIYMAIRAGVLLMILYFYSSIERFVFVTLCCVFMYGLQAGWFGRRGPIGNQQQQQQPGNAVQNAAAAPPIPQNENAGDRENLVDANAENQRQNDGHRAPMENHPEEELPMTAWNVFWTTCWTFISSFFASLVPERAPPLNL